MRVPGFATAGIVLCLSPVPARAQTTRPLTSDPQKASLQVDYSVVYTGRMFGFFTRPSQQTDRQTSCDDAAGPASDPAKVLVRAMTELAPEGTALRVAVGDNFSPFVLARQMKLEKENRFVPKDLYLYDDEQQRWVLTTKPPSRLTERIVAGQARLTVDNVACFLRYAQFDAVVPGKHDFYFGAERLRALAGLLAAPGTPQFASVQMLGANLSLAAADRDRVPIPDRDLRPHGYTDKADVVGGAQPILPKTPLPWLRRIPVKNVFRVNSVKDPNRREASYDFDELLASATFDPEQLDMLAKAPPGPVTVTDTDGREYVVAPNAGAVLICPADRKDPRKISLPTQSDDPQPCRTLKRSMPQQARKLSLTWPFHVPARPDAGPDEDVADEYALPPNTNQAVCLYRSEKFTGTPYCVPFSVHAPFLEPLTPPDRRIATGCEMMPSGRVAPYALKSLPGGHCIAVFGVVDPSLRELVGALNDSWLNTGPDGNVLDRSIVTQLEVSDPVEAMVQVLQYCDASTVCRTARKILLAHMPRGKAAPLAARFKTGTFDVVVSQTDADRASGNSRIELTVGLDGDTSVDAASDPTVVLTPGPHFDGTDSDTIRVRVHKADVSITPDGHTERRVVANTAERRKPLRVTQLPPPSDLPQGSDAKTLFAWIAESAFGQQLVAGTRPALHGERMALLERVALATLQAQCNADVALMQHRDVFLSSNLESYSVDATTLRLMLDAVYWKGDFVACRSVTGATLKALLARSREVSSAEANSVSGDLEFGRSLATLGIVRDGDDFLVGGQLLDSRKLYALATTDFLAEGDTGYAVLQTADPKPDAIGGLGTIDRLSGLIHTRIVGKTGGLQTGDTKLRADRYLDLLSMQPFDVTRQTWTGVVADFFKDFAHPIKAPVPGADRRAEQRPIMAMTLETLNLSRTTYAHSDTESQVNGNFGGSSNSALIAPESKSLGRDLQLRVRRSPSWGDYYSFTELHAQRDEKKTADDRSTVVSQTRNLFAQELGVLTNLWPRERNPSSYKILTAGRFETQVDEPFQNIDVGGTTIPVPIPRDQTLSGKIGLRHEYKDSSFEVGWLGGKKYHRATSFAFNGSLQGASTSAFCPVVAEMTVKACLKGKLDQYVSSDVATSDHPQFGAFFNFRLHVPLGRTLKFLSQESGEFYRRRDEDDLSIDTRYFIDWKNSLEVPLFGNFSLAPTIGWLFYENKVKAATYRSHKVSIELKYAFDWRSGLGFGNALVFANPADTAR